MRILIDCDPGIDDALAIALAYSSDGVEVASIETVCGNVGVDQSTKNLLKVLNLLKVEFYPLIGKGSSRPLARKPVSARGVHGRDGLADLGISISDVCPKIFDGVRLFIETLSRGRIDTVVALGPLTNLARAIEKAPWITKRIRRLVVMGGAVHVPGNITPHAEFNFYVDPEAASFVIKKGLPLTLVSLDTTQSFMLEREDAAPLSGYKNQLGNFLNGIINYSINSHRSRFGLRGAYIHDPLAMAVAIDPDLGCFEKVAIGVDCANRKGAVVLRQGRPNASVLKKTDVRRFKNMFIKKLRDRIETSL